MSERLTKKIGEFAYDVDQKAIKGLETLIEKNVWCADCEEENDIIAECKKENEWFFAAIEALQEKAVRDKGCGWCVTPQGRFYTRKDMGQAKHCQDCGRKLGED